MPGCFQPFYKKKYFPNADHEKDLNLSAELKRIGAPNDLRRKVVKLVNTEQSLRSNSATISHMSNVNDNNAKSECISDPEICALLDSQSVEQIVDYFRPVMRTVLKEVHMLPDWDTGHLAETLGVKEQDLADILEGKSTNNELSCMLRILASLKWAATHSTLFSGVQKYLLLCNNGNSKLEFKIILEA